MYRCALARLAAVSSLLAVSACGGGSDERGGITDIRPSRTLSSVSVTGTSTLAPGQTAQFTATARFGDGSTETVTASSTWSSSNTSVATVSPAGMVTAAAEGSAEIRAAYQNVTGAAAVGVSAPASGRTVSSVRIGGINALVVGQTSQFSAIATFSDGTTATVTNESSWSSTNTGVASVSMTGVVSANQEGEADIRAVYQNVTGSTTVQVSRSGPPPAPATKAAFTVVPEPNTVPAGQCAVSPQGGNNVLRCTFDASSSTPTPGIVEYRWQIPVDANPLVQLDGAQYQKVTNHLLPCSTAGLAGDGAVTKQVRLTVVGPGNTSDTITQNVTFVRAGAC